MREDTGDHMRHDILAAFAAGGDIDVHAVARLAAQRLRGEVSGETVAHGDGIYDRAECDRIVRGLDGLGIAEIDLVLPRPLLVVGTLRTDTHLFERQADLTADVLALIPGRNVHIPGAVVRDRGRLAVFVAAEEVELHLRAERERNAHRRGVIHRLLQQSAAVTFEGRAVRMKDAAEQARHAPVIRPPREQTKRRGVRLQKEVRVQLIAEAGDGGGVKRDAGGKRAVKRVRQNGHILLVAGQIKKRHAEELDILLRNILPDLGFGILHAAPAFLNRKRTFAYRDSCCPA